MICSKKFEGFCFEFEHKSRSCSLLVYGGNLRPLSNLQLLVLWIITNLCPNVQSNHQAWSITAAITCSLFAATSCNQPRVVLSHTKSAPATSLPAIFFSHNKSASATAQWTGWMQQIKFTEHARRQVRRWKRLGLKPFGVGFVRKRLRFTYKFVAVCVFVFTARV